MHRSRFHSHHRTAAILHELVDYGLCIVIFAVLESCEGAHGNDVAVACHHWDGFEQVLALVTVHDDATLGFQFPCTSIHIEHDDVHTQVHGSFLRAEARAQTVVEEYHQQCLVLTQ